jgi:hypothetical protein
MRVTPRLLRQGVGEDKDPLFISPSYASQEGPRVIRHSGESRNPAGIWTPASAGVTETEDENDDEDNVR